jgi:aspartyl-tRNA(Asn)/glutamyl-tRNA(Gln) amidotransferase subunit C
MNIDKTTLQKLQKLSHLHIDDSQIDEYIEDLSNILSYVDNLNELNTDNLDSFFSTLEGGTPLREDEPREENTISRDILDNAPNASDDFFIVPAIIE